MQKKDIVPGETYAVREGGLEGAPLQQVRALEHIRRDKWRVEWIEPNRGLIDFVKSGAIVCPWSERKAFLRDEQNHTSLVRERERSWPGHDHPVAEAVDVIFEATGESVSAYSGILSGPPDALDRLAERAHYVLPEDGLGYRDRFGTRCLPWQVAVDLARSLAATEPRTVLLRVEADERKYEIEAREPGNSYLLPLVDRWRASWALVRQWAGFEEDRARLEAEITRLRELITRTVWDLRRPDLDGERLAARLERALKGQ